MKKLIIIAVMLLSAFTLFAEDSVFVLCYHSFTGNPKNDYDLPVETLKSQLTILKDKGFSFITFSDFSSGNIKGKKNILVTIDDGYLSSYEAYKNVFKPLGIKPVFAIYPSIIGRSKTYMNWEQVKELSTEGLEIASHGYNHEHINQKLFDKKPKVFENEIFKSKKELEEKLGITVNTFIYPFGIRSPITVEYLKKAGYKYGFTINWGKVEIPLDKNKSVYELPRYMLTQKAWKDEFKIIESKGK